MVQNQDPLRRAISEPETFVGFLTMGRLLEHDKAMSHTKFRAAETSNSGQEELKVYLFYTFEPKNTLQRGRLGLFGPWGCHLSKLGIEPFGNITNQI